MPQRISGDRVLLSTLEAMQVSGLSREHIQRLLRNRQLEGLKLGHDWLVFEDTLKIYVAQPHKTGPKGPRKKSGQHNQTTSSTSINQSREYVEPNLDNLNTTTT